MGAWGAGVEPHAVNSLWKSNGLYHYFNLNPSDKDNPSPTYAWEKRIDELYNAGAAELDETKRKEIYNEFQRIVADEQILIFRPVFFYTVAVRDNIGNMAPSAYSSLGTGWNSWELYKK